MEKLVIRENLSEIIEYNAAELLIRSTRVKLSDYYRKMAACHWHDELEFILPLTNFMNYYVNGKTYTLKEGMGIVINASRLHYAFSNQNEDCEFIALLLNPSLLCGNATIENKYVTPFIYDTKTDAILLSGEEPWHKEAIACITLIYELSQKQPEQYELKIQSQFFLLWSILYANTVLENGFQEIKNGYMQALKEMIDFIQKRYKEQIVLTDIAAAGKVCRSKCCALFRENMHQTPKEYLQGHRIRQSLPLLLDMRLSITEVAFKCGFHNPSYYTETFHRLMGTTPTEYRLEKVKQS